MTEIEEDSDDKAQDDDLQLNPEEILKQSQEIDKLCCPKIVSVSMEMNIVHCRHIIEVTKNTKVSKCLDCNHTRNVSKCERKFEESLEIEKGNIFSPFTLNNLDLMNEMFLDPAT